MANTDVEKDGKKMKKTIKILTTALLLTAGFTTSAFAERVGIPNNTPVGSVIKAEKLKLENTWDKTFKKSEKVDHKKVTFVNRYGITLAADMYIPKNAKGKLAAIAVSGPFGAVKEQCSGLYAQEMAERGYLTIAFDPSFTGESGGYPRYVQSPDINTEDFSAAVDFLSTQANVDANKVGIIGICGWGGLAVNAAAADPRIKATVAVTMYDMSRVNANGYFDAMDAKARYEARKTVSDQRTADYKNGYYKLQGGVPDRLGDDAPQFVKDYFDYYKTERGYHKRSLNSNGGRTSTNPYSFMNMPLLTYSNEIQNAVMLVHGDKAHSFYFSKDAYANMIKDNPYADNKEFVIIPGASHTDLYDGGEKKVIPFDKLQAFFDKNM